jgi:predicted Zn-dependent peptidase
MESYYDAWLFRGHAFARPPSGDEGSLASLRIDDVRALAEQQLGPGRVWLAVAGDFDADALRAGLERRFGDWGHVSPQPPAPPPPARPAASRVLLVDKPDALQTYFWFGNLGIDWTHPDYPARYLANTVLGGRFTSRLNTALRIEGGLTYGAGSRFDDVLAGAFSVRTYTATPTSGEAIRLALHVLRSFVADGITAEELDSARTYVQGQYAPDNVETAEQAAGMVLALEFAGLPRARVDRFFADLDALTPDEVNRVVREHFPADALSWVIVGRAEVVRPIAAELGDVTEVRVSDPGFGPR